MGTESVHASAFESSGQRDWRTKKRREKRGSAAAKPARPRVRAGVPGGGGPGGRAAALGARAEGGGGAGGGRRGGAGGGRWGRGGGARHALSGPPPRPRHSALRRRVRGGHAVHPPARGCGTRTPASGAR